MKWLRVSRESWKHTITKMGGSFWTQKKGFTVGDRVKIYVGREFVAMVEVLGILTVTTNDVHEHLRHNFKQDKPVSELNVKILDSFETGELK